MLPIQPEHKRPLLPDWVKMASCDLRVIDGWLFRWPKMNIGVACGKGSGFFTVDVDKKNGGMETLASVQRSAKRFPPTLTARTPSGGLHLLYRADADFSPGNIKLDPFGFGGIETRGEGGQILVAPSITVEEFDKHGKQKQWGGRYEWDNNLPIAEPPAWFVDLLTVKPTTSQRAIAARHFQEQRREEKPFQHVENVARKLAGMPTGGRNNFLSRATFAMAVNLVSEGRVPLEHVAERMRHAALASGLDEDETDKTIKSAFKGAAGKGRK